MSTDLENVLVVEKLMDLEKVTNPANTVLIGPVFKTLNRFPAAAVSNTQIVFNNIVAPSLTTVMKRTLRIEMEVQVAVTTGGGAGQLKTDPQFNAVNATTGAPVALLNDATNANICLRAFPLSGVCSSVDIRLNGGSTNCALASYSQIYPFLQGVNDAKRYASECPLQADNSAKYENTSATSPFNGINGNSATQPRGSFIATLVSIVGAIATYNIKWTEELIVSPFLTGANMEDIGLVNVNNLTVTLRLNDLNGMFSGAFTTGTIATSILALPNLLVEFDTQNSIMSQRSPQNAVYPYNQIQTYQQTIASLPIPGAEATISLTALRLPCQPSKIYCYIAPVARTTKVPDHFLRIVGVSVNFNNKNSLLNGMDESSLYTMSAFNAGSERNGFMSWNQWKYGSGSLVVIDVQRDLSVDEGSQSGSQNQFSTLQITLRYTSTNLLYSGLTVTGADPTLVVASSYNAFQVIVSPGKAYVSASQCEFVVQGPSPAVVLGLVADESSTKIPEDAVPDSDNADGKGFSDLIQKGLKLAYQHRDVIMSAAAPHIKKLMGSGGSIDGGMVSAGALKHRRA